METILHKADVIRGRRAFRDMSQDELSKAIKMSRYTIIRLERGDTHVSLEAVALVAKSLDLPLEEVLNEEGKRKLSALLVQGID